MPFQVLAFLDLIEEAPGGIRSPMRIDIGYPLRNPDGLWTCDVSIGGRTEHHKVLLGADAFQSICIAIRFVKITSSVARTNLVYPKMPGSGEAPIGNCIAFEKYDGTNIHWVWDATLGWYAFGTRRDRFDLDDQGIAAFNAAHPGLEECSEVFLGAYAEQLASVLCDLEYYGSDELIVFTEFLGEHSFAGKHLSSDTKRLVIIDLQTANGFLSPAQFEKELVNLPIARTVYRGKLTGKFADDVREGRFGVAEGVVCKGESEGQVWMVKIKTNAYRKRLKDAFADNWEDFWE